jgi:aspartyl aminopeptidase
MRFLNVARLKGTENMKDETLLRDLLDFLDGSPTASLAVSGLAASLQENGFTRLEESGRLSAAPGTRFCIVRSSSSIIAGIAGVQPIKDTGFRIIGAHTDFPGFRIKPCPDRKTEGISTIGVEVYGGPIIATWFDRDLSVAGTLALRRGDDISRAPFILRDPLFRMASPAIHLERETNKEGFKVDPEKNTPLIFSTSGAAFDDILSMACRSADVEKAEVAGWSMEVWDPQPAVAGGLDGDFIFSGRLDNLAMCHAAVKALMEAGEGPSTTLVSLFNSEEVGSRTLNGAGSLFLDSVMERLAGDRESYFRSIPRSVQVSADGAHGLHPNYAGKHDPGCRPLLNGGPVIKVNAQERYTSTDLTSAYFSTCAQRCGVEVQYFVSRNDMPCGSTIGPVTSSRTGIRSVDAGNPMLSMHSVRETAGAKDHGAMVKVLAEHLRGGVSLAD